MHRSLALLLFALLIPPPAPGAATSCLSLDGPWQMTRTAGSSPPGAEARWQTVAVPHLIEQTNATPFLWYRRPLQIPGAWHGRRLFLQFEGVKHVAEVSVDGRRLGGHAGGFEPWEIDLTGACRPGAEHELIVRVQDVTGLIDGKIDASKLEPGMRFVSLAKDALMAPIGSQYGRGGIWQSVSLLGRADVYADDVFVRTSVRKHELAADITLRNLTPRPRTARVSATVEGGPAIGTGEIALPARGSATLTLAVPWPDARLWGPEDPHLYRLTTRVESEGTESDRVTTRFGFREFWTEGPDLVLNGTPMKFLATAGHPRGGVAPAEARAEALDLYRRIREAGCVAMRLHANIWPRAWYEVADEIGLPIILESALFCWADSYALGKDVFWRNYHEHLRAIVRAHRNHPSIVMTSLENEILHCGGSRVPETEHRLAEAGRLVKALDPTRPILFDADADPEGVADVVNLHYPIDFNRRNLWPDAGYWLETGLEVAGWPHRFWAWDRKKPLYLGEFLHLQHYNEADPYTTLLGNDAYLGHVEAMARAKALAWEMQIQAYRACDVSGLVPWTLTETGPFPSDDNPRYLAVKRAYQNNAAFIREYDTRFHGGDDVERTIYLYNDTLHPATLRFDWRLKRGDATDAEGTRNVRLDPARKERFTIRVPMPRVDARTVATLALQVHNGARPVFESASRIDILPRRPVAVPARLRLAVFGALPDPLAAAFKEAGVRLAALSRLDALPECDALLIAPHALDKIPAPAASPVVGRPGPRERLEEFVGRGGTVIALEQDSYACDLLPATLADRACTIAFRRARDPLLLTGLEDDDFRFWRGDHVVARRTLHKPVAGRFRALADSGGPEGLVYLPWLEIAHGRGRYLLCQLLIGEKYGREPVAQVVLENMLRVAATPRPAPTVVGVVQDQLPLTDSLAEIDARHEDLSGRLASADLDRVGILLLETDSREVADHLDKIAGFARNGGRVILHGGTPAGLARVAALLPEPMTLQPSTVLPVNLAGWDPAIDGLTNQELYWYQERKGLHYRIHTPLSAEVCRYTIVPALPESPAWTTVEARDMKLVEGHADLRADHASLWRTGTLEARIDVPAAGPYAVALRLRGTPMDGVYPHMAVNIGEQTRVVIAAPGQQWDVAWTAATLHAGSQTVRLSFINDAHNPATKEDRNVAVARLMLAPIKPLASACLMQPNALVKGSFGKGSVLIDQIRWETDCAGSPASGRYVSNLLTNLGAEFGARGTVIPAERFAFEREGPAFSIRNGRAYLGANGTITCRIAFAQAGPREFRIRARGTEMDGVFPIMAVRIDGRSVGEVSLRRAGWQTVALVVQAPAGTHDLSLAFTNDAYRPPEDRNLTIESVEIRPGGAPAQRH